MRNTLIQIMVIFLLIIFYTSIFIVQEGKIGIILRFSKILRDKDEKLLIYNPGIHIKIPFIEKVKNIDVRIHTMENKNKFLTMDKKNLIIDYYINWRIKNFSNYLATSGIDVYKAESILKFKCYDLLRSEINRLDMKDIITDYRCRIIKNVRYLLNNGTSNKHERIQNITNISNYSYIPDIINLKNKNSMAELGILVMNVSIKQINLSTEFLDVIYQRMRAEREIIAHQYRLRGKEKAEKIRATADYEFIHILSEANRQNFIIRGESDTENIKIYAEAFNEYPDFYTFISIISAYKNSLKSNNKFMILSS